MTPGALRTLQDLAIDEDIDLLVEGHLAYVGTRLTTCRVVNELLGCFALDVVDRDEKTRRYTISATGHSIIRRPQLEAELYRWMLARPRRPFTIIGDRVKPVSALEKQSRARR